MFTRHVVVVCVESEAVEHSTVDKDCLVLTVPVSVCIGCVCGVFISCLLCICGVFISCVLCICGVFISCVLCIILHLVYSLTLGNRVYYT